jgi:hypothetical protein
MRFRKKKKRRRLWNVMGWSANKKGKERRREEAKMANQRNKETKSEGEKNDDDRT